MALALIFAILLVLFLGLALRPAPFIRTAQRLLVKNIYLDSRRFYVEKANYASYHKALHFYYQLVPLIQGRPELLEVKYSFLDWCDATFIFARDQIKLLRVIDRIYLIKSYERLELEIFEQCAADIVRQMD